MQEEKEMRMKTQVQVRFSKFYEKWLPQLDEYLKQLLMAQKNHQNNQNQSSDDQFYKVLISNIMNHYKEYFSTKWEESRESVTSFFCPPWVTPLENAYLWMTGWKPSMLFRLIRSLNQPRLVPNSVIGGSLVNLTDYQLGKIEELRLRTSLEEKSVDSEMERQQMSLADRKMVELARLSSNRIGRKNGEGNSVEDRQVDQMVEAALNGLIGELEKLVKTADCVRLKGLRGLLEVLTPLQSVDFMAAFLVLQFQLRRFGNEKMSATTAN